jgi:hypothetical protein
MKKPDVTLLALLLLTAGMAAAQQASDGLQFNVPYLCSDGQTYTVHRCAVGSKGEFCYYQAEGQSERYNTRASVVYQMTKMCKVKAAGVGAAVASSQTAQSSSDLQLNTPYQCPGGLTLTVFQCQRQQGQEYCFVRAEQNGKFITQVPKPRAEAATQLKACQAGTPFNPPYIAEFPSAYRVVQGMNIGKPAENVRRAIGAFYQLSEVILVLAGQRAPTPDEQKLLNDYSRISTVLAQGAAQKFPNEEFDLAANPYRYSRSDPKFGFEGIPVWTTFLSPGLEAQFAQLVGGNDPRYQAAVEQEKQKALHQVQADVQTAQAAQSEANMPKDAGSVEIRRCLESGRSETECLGKGLKTGMDELTGGLMSSIDKATAPPPGLRLSGNFSGSGFGISFDDKIATVYCGTLQPVLAAYQVERGPQIAVRVGINPKPLAVTLRPDGKLSGPGPIQVAGVVPAGGGVGSGPAGPSASAYELHSPTTTQEKQISAAEVPQYSADQVHQNGMEHSATTTQAANIGSDTSWAKPRPAVPMVAKTEHCNVTTLAGTPVTKTSAAVSQLIGSSPGKVSTIPLGLRMYGTYGNQGLKIDFEGDLATLECGRARAAEPYTVENAAGHITIHVQNEGAPFSLTFQPDGTLAGTGGIDVSGKVLTGHNGNQMTYAPVSGRCALGSLAASKN